MGDIAGRTKVEVAETNNIDRAMSGIHLPELSRRDAPLEQPFSPHFEFAKVLAAARMPSSMKIAGDSGFL
jgi:hypothetical protein